ncbi:MAG: tryptophan--tRNA ligase [Acidobacteriota bacterium]
MEKKRVLSGMRPTGLLHLGHFFGALQNWVKLQEDHECFYCIVDYHALTTDYEDTSNLKDYIFNMAVDWMAAGLNPKKSTIFIQSAVKEHAELHLLLSMVVPLGWLLRVPTYKEQLREIKGKDLHTYGFLGYPVLQAADIVVYKAGIVPIGEDQLPHLELTREIVRRFNHFYGNVFPEPEAMLTEVSRLPGTDGRKMSKSYNNSIFLSDPPELMRSKIMMMVTDPARKRRNDPGNPDICPVFAFHKVFSPPEKIVEIDRECRRAGIGCTECKSYLADHVKKRFSDFIDRRNQFASDKRKMEAMLAEGAERARAVASETVREVREAVKL